jgi:hypothetical protein
MTTLRIRATYAGMAHFAGTGPEGRTCRACIFWTGCGDPVGYSSKLGTPNPRRCAKYQAVMNGKRGDKVPHDARACRHFEDTRASQPPLQGPRRLVIMPSIQTHGTNANDRRTETKD